MAERTGIFIHVRRTGVRNLGGPVAVSDRKRLRGNPYFLFVLSGDALAVKSWAAVKRRARALLAAGAYQVVYAEGSTWAGEQPPTREQIYARARRGYGGRFRLDLGGNLFRSPVDGA